MYKYLVNIVDYQFLILGIINIINKNMDFNLLIIFNKVIKVCNL